MLFSGAMAGEAIPSFYLYGEPNRAVDTAFIHVETLDDRSRPNEWTIRAHSHVELNHIFLITEGGGTILVDGRRFECSAPVLLLIPATLIHGFTWARESCGWVATLAQAERNRLQEGNPEIAGLFTAARVVPLTAASAERAETHLAMMARELSWSLPGQLTALRAAILDLMVLALRGIAVAAKMAPRPQAALVARFHDRVEQRFRFRESVRNHAEALNVSESCLRSACTRIAGMAPAAIIDQRTLLEAQRSLLYSTLPVSEIGYSLGFSDPAYFSRFFTKNMGRSPRAFRLERMMAGA
jgi:AraC family transcriptional activator of pobA